MSNPGAEGGVVLCVRRRFDASPERVFAAWTRPEQVRAWWGPANVTCTEAHIDLKPDGGYALANQLPNGDILWIRGRFLEIDAPRRLVYTWAVGEDGAHASRVTVRFDPDGDGCALTLTHEQIEDRPTADHHEAGWIGCLDGLERFVGRTSVGPDDIVGA